MKLDWLDWFLTVYAEQVAWAFVGLLAVWVAILIYRYDRLAQERDKLACALKHWQEIAAALDRELEMLRFFRIEHFS